MRTFSHRFRTDFNNTRGQPPTTEKGLAPQLMIWCVHVCLSIKGWDPTCGIPFFQDRCETLCFDVAFLV